MILNEQGFWRLGISAAAGVMATVVMATLLVVRRSPKVPLTVGVMTAITAYIVDWYTTPDRRT